MQYREFGRTGKKVSLLGFGAMRLPKDEDEAIRIMRRAIDLGVNYVDTARLYGESERIVGMALKDGYREKVYLSTKVMPTEQPAWRESFEKSMELLDVQRIDFLQAVHDLSWKGYTEKYTQANGARPDVLKARDEGLITHICFSCHDNPENMTKLIDTGEFEGITLQYNLLDRTNEDVIAHAHEQGMGVVIMGPVGGGRLAAPSEVLEAMKSKGRHISSTAGLALRFVFANPHVSIAISGMNTMEMVEENVATASHDESLSPSELADIRRSVEELEALGKQFCTGCRYCMPCPNNVAIPGIFEAYILHKVWGQTKEARARYARWFSGKPAYPNDTGFATRLSATACVECGECEPKCPQKIPIIAQLKEAHEELGE